MLNPNNFRLQSVLDLKSSMVDNLEIEFASLKTSHNQEVARLDQLEQDKDRQLDQLARQQQGQIDCQSIQLHHQFLSGLDRQLNQQAERVETARQQMEGKRQELVDTMQDQKSLEKLRDRHQDQVRRDQQRRETRTTDDLVIAKYGRERLNR
ncbi:MAG TPA: flagellar export protein FliJ [Anaerolineae bacterium]|nr:flagellar export protein FliJ [Anaerolineae bacterium]HMR64309.1 flagellar export protein FliJ [Anaerolineae bacterium]